MSDTPEGLRERIAEALPPLGRIYCGDCKSYDYECGCSPSVVERYQERAIDDLVALLAENTPERERHLCPYCENPTIPMHYCEACGAKGRMRTIEECARVADGCDKSTHPADVADRIRALTPQPRAMGEREIVRDQWFAEWDTIDGERVLVVGSLTAYDVAFIPESEVAELVAFAQQARTDVGEPLPQVSQP